MVEKKTIRSDIPGHHNYLSGGYYGHDDMRRMVVGRGINVQGNVADCDHLVVEGNVEAEGFKARRMDIAEPGLFNGSAIIEDAIIAGRFEGNLTVTGRLVVRATGRIKGEVTYGSLEVEAGASIEGKIAPAKKAEAPKKPENLKVEKPSVVTLAPVASNVENLFEEDDANDSAEDDAQDPISAKERGGVYRRAAGFN